MMGYELPSTITVGGNVYRIRTDFRDIINIIIALTDPNLDDVEKAYVFFSALFIDPVPSSDMEEAQRAGYDFIQAGIKGDDAPSPKLMDWEQDAPLVIPAINKITGKDVRGVDYMHWWTFVGYYMEIGESQFSTVVSIRKKIKQHTKLDKSESEYYRHNKSIVDLKCKLSDEELDALDELIGWRDENA